MPWLTGLDGSSLTGGTNVSRAGTPFANGVAEADLTLSFDYPYQTFPQDVAIYVDATYAAKMPYTHLTWIKPDGEEIDLGSAPISSRTTTLFMSQDSRLRRKYGEKMAAEGLFLDMTSETPRARPAPTGSSSTAQFSRRRRPWTPNWSSLARLPGWPARITTAGTSWSD